MANFEELKQLSDPEPKKREEAVERLSMLGKEDIQKAIEALKERLGVEDYIHIIKGIVKKLKEFKEPDNNIIQILKKRLETDPNFWGIVASVNELATFGMTVEQMSRILARNPNLVGWPHRYWHRLWHGGGMVRQVVEHALHQQWWRLPADFRRNFGPPWWFPDEPWHHRCPECHEMWWKLAHLLERREEAEWLIATMGRWWGSPRWHFARHDFEGLMSLRVEQSVIYEEQNVLRFRYLDAFATDRQGRPVSEQASGERRPDWDELLRIEEQFDRVRDEVSDLKRRQEEILREAERRREGRPVEPGEPLPQDLQGQWHEIAERLARLEEEFQKSRHLLEEATEKFLPKLRERGVRFRVIEIEGVLGEYNFYERKITLYPPMIELVADELATPLRRSKKDIYEDLYTITEMHETAHATAHLGIDSNGNLWEHPEQGTSELHELLAQLYTIHLIRRLRNTHLEKVFLELNKRQPERYRYWKILQDVPLEMIRTFLIAKRSSRIKIRPKSLQYASEEVRRALDEIAMSLIGTILENHTKLLLAHLLVAGPPLNQPTLRMYTIADLIPKSTTLKRPANDDSDSDSDNDTSSETERNE